MSYRRHANRDEEFSSTESSGSVSNRGRRSDDEKGSVVLSPARPDSPSVEPMDDDHAGNEGSATGVGSGDGKAIAVAAAPPRTRGPSQQAPKRPFRPQSCRLRDQPHVFEARSGLNDHATVHHGTFYSAWVTTS